MYSFFTVVLTVLSVWQRVTKGGRQDTDPNELSTPQWQLLIGQEPLSNMRRGSDPDSLNVSDEPMTPVDWIMNFTRRHFEN